MITLAASEEIIDASGVAARIEAMLPAGVRPRQLRVRTLLAGIRARVRDELVEVRAEQDTRGGIGQVSLVIPSLAWR